MVAWLLHPGASQSPSCMPTAKQCIFQQFDVPVLDRVGSIVPRYEHLSKPLSHRLAHWIPTGASPWWRG